MQVAFGSGCFIPGEGYPTPIEQEAEWSSNPLCTLCRKEKPLDRAGN